MSFIYIYIHKIHVFSIVFYVNLYACRSCVLPIGQFVKILCSNLIFSWFFQVHSNEQAGWWRHGVCFGGRFGPTPIWTIWNHWSLHPWDNPPGAVETAKFLCRLWLGAILRGWTDWCGEVVGRWTWWNFCVEISRWPAHILSLSLNCFRRDSGPKW